MSATGLKLVRQFTTQAAAAESAPTAASAWVDLNDQGGQHFKKMKLLATAVTKTSTPTSTLFQAWHKVGDVIVAGKQFTLTYANGVLPEQDLGVVPGEAVYVTSLGTTGGTTPTFTMGIYAAKYNDDDAAV